MAGSVGSEDGDIGFQIAPIVDVVFVLMLFFMASAGAQVIEKELSINLPSNTSESKSDTPILPIIVAIAAEAATCRKRATSSRACWSSATRTR